jgi:hypothetical protein
MDVDGRDRSVAREVPAFYRAVASEGSPLSVTYFMSFHRALLAFALFAGAPVTASAQSARLIEGSFGITFANISGFRIDFTAKIDGDRYDVETHTYKESVLYAVTMRYDARNHAWGSFVPQGARPSAGSLSLLVQDKTRTWLAVYGPGGTLQETHNPVYKPEPKDTIPEDKKIGSLDPLSATIALGALGEQACNHSTAPSNDGQRRLDVILEKVRTTPADRTDIQGARGDVLECHVYTKRVAGLFYDAKPEEAESERERPMTLWLARLDDLPFYYPAKLEAATGFGTIRGRILNFHERPLTDEEKVAMRH